jgi:hypothetical protein
LHVVVLVGVVVAVLVVIVVDGVIGFTVLLVRVKAAAAGPVATIENGPITFGL